MIKNYYNEKNYKGIKLYIFITRALKLSFSFNYFMTYKIKKNIIAILLN